jgi:hypothetical protein
VSNLSFVPIDKSMLSHIATIYKSLHNPLADLNATMVAAWQSVLNLRCHIDKDGTLYVIGFFENEYCGWGPPIGPSVKETHISVLFNALDDLNGKPSSILYLWEDYQLLPTLRQSTLYSISDQASEYIYSSKKIASLPRETMKSFAKKREAFCRKHKPVVRQYSSLLADDCLLVLKNWLRQKQAKVPLQHLDKFRIEADVCKKAIQEKLLLSGVVVYINGSPEGFSLGVEHSESCFNCMFEKTNLSIDGLSIFVFSKLGEMLKNDFQLINAGEDWGVPYLKDSKLRWHPSRVQKSYRMMRNA